MAKLFQSTEIQLDLRPICTSNGIFVLNHFSNRQQSVHPGIKNWKTTTKPNFDRGDYKKRPQGCQGES